MQSNFEKIKRTKPKSSEWNDSSRKSKKNKVKRQPKEWNLS